MFEEYDPPSYGRHPALEGMEEQRQIFGMENPDQEWILTGWDVWVKNPFYTGPAGPHPEDYPYDDTEDEPTPLESNYRAYQLDLPKEEEDEEDLPF